MVPNKCCRCCYLVTKRCVAPLILLMLSSMYVIILFAESRTHRSYTPLPKGGFITVFKNGGSVSRDYNQSLRVQFVTKYFGRWQQRSKIIQQYKAMRCEWRCDFSMSETARDDSDVLVFHAWDLGRHPDDVTRLHARRREEQRWLLESGESPWLTKLDVGLYGNVFNMTSFVRQDSDVPNTYSYGRMKALSQARATPDVGVKPKLVYWLMSNCVTLNHRDAYVDELRNYVTVDIYGGSDCFPDAIICARGDVTCDKLADTYNFYLAFENANCRDYVTEKLWRSLRNGVIPVVMGDSESYRRVAPQGSYIDVADFRSARHLAEHLLKVERNGTLYKSYFAWRRDFEIVDKWPCDLCEYLHQWNGTKQVYSDLKGWYQQDTCVSENPIGSAYAWTMSKSRALWRKLRMNIAS